MPVDVDRTKKVTPRDNTLCEDEHEKTKNTVFSASSPIHRICVDYDVTSSTTRCHDHATLVTTGYAHSQCINDFTTTSWLCHLWRWITTIATISSKFDMLTLDDIVAIVEIHRREGHRHDIVEKSYSYGLAHGCIDSLCADDHMTPFPANMQISTSCVPTRSTNTRNNGDELIRRILTIRQRTLRWRYTNSLAFGDLVAFLIKEPSNITGNCV